MRVVRLRLRAAAIAALAGVTVTAGLTALLVPARATSTFTLQRLQGNDRYQTAGVIDQAAFPSGEPTVLLADGVPGHEADALSASGLEGVNSIGVLLTDNTGTVPPNTLSALQNNKVKNISVLGGTAAVSQSQIDSLKGAGYNVVTPFQGTTRYQTMQMVDNAIGPTNVGKDGSGNPTAILASGDNAHFVDALSAGGLAYAKKFPVILTNSTGPGLQPEAQQVISSLGIKHLIVVGGTAAIPASEYTPNPQGVTQVEVEAGKDRSQTSKVVADYGIGKGWLGSSSMTVGRGDDGADALAGAPFSGSKALPTVVTNSPTDVGSATAFASEHAATLAGTSYVFGGVSAVPDSQVAAIQAAGQSGSNQSYSVTPGTAQTVNTTSTSHGSVNYTASGIPAATTVTIQLFNCSNVHTNTGSVTFAGSNPGGTGNTAQPGTVSHETITSVNGTTASSPSTKSTATSGSGGAVTFTVTNDGTPGECVVPVVYQDTNANGSLDLNSDGTASEPFGAGGSATFVSNAPAGSFNGGGNNQLGIAQFPTPSSSNTVQAEPTSSSFSQGGLAYVYGPNDTYQLFQGQSSSPSNGQCTSDSFADFQRRLSTGDQVGGNYNPGGTSTFCLNDIAPSPPSTVSAAPNTSLGGVTVIFNPSGTPDVTQYNVYHSPQTTNALNQASCPSTSPNVSPQNPPSANSSFTLAGSVPATASRDSSGNYVFNDTGVAGGTAKLCYYVSSVGPNAMSGSQEGTGQGSGANSSTAGVTPAPAPPPPSGSPQFASSTVQNEVVTLTYNQAINCSTADTNGSDYSVSYTASGTTHQDAASTRIRCQAGSNSTPVSPGVVIIVLSTPVPSAAPTTVRPQAGSDGNTVCAAGGTSNCQAATDSTQATAADGNAPAMSSATASSGTSTVTITYNEVLVCSTVGTGDFNVKVDSGSPTTVSGACTTPSAGYDSGTGFSDVVRIGGVTMTAGQSVTVCSQQGSDGDTVFSPYSSQPEPAADCKTVTAS